jgi:predicted RNase H-like HicB family nuclease
MTGPNRPYPSEPGEIGTYHPKGGSCPTICQRAMIEDVRWSANGPAMNYYSFEILIEKEPEDEGYYAYSPTLPGCFGSGKTIEEAKRNIRLAVSQHIDALLAHGQPIPQHEHLVHVEELTVGIPA